jgi:hypothetical protein
LIPKNQQDGTTAWQGAALALLLLLTATLVACNGFAASTEVPSATPTEPGQPAVALDANYQKVAADRLRSTFKNYATYDQFQISEPRWVHALQGWSWLICIRFLDRGRVNNYALFLKSGAIVDSRYAVATDGCDMQTYAPFEAMAAGGLQPLH